MEKWTAEQLRSMDDLTFAITMLNECRSKTLPDTPLSMKLAEAARTLAEYKHIGLTPAQIENLQEENLKLTTPDTMRQRQLEIIAEKVEAHGGIDHLIALDQAAMDGQIIIPPCKVGSILYRPAGGYVNQFKVQEYVVTRQYILEGEIGIFACWIKPDGSASTSSEYFSAADVGKKVFLTREEAEEADQRRRRELALQRRKWQQVPSPSDGQQ